MSRIDGSVLLVGSIPGSDAEQVMQFCAGELGDNVSFLPDGETGFRKMWINFLAATVYRRQRYPGDGQPARTRQPGRPGRMA